MGWISGNEMGRVTTNYTNLHESLGMPTPRAAGRAKARTAHCEQARKLPSVPSLPPTFVGARPSARGGTYGLIGWTEDCSEKGNVRNRLPRKDCCLVPRSRDTGRICGNERGRATTNYTNLHESPGKPAPLSRGWAKARAAHCASAQAAARTFALPAAPAGIPPGEGAYGPIGCREARRRVSLEQSAEAG